MILATRNGHKVRELVEILPGAEIRSLPEGIELPPETGATFEENALVKARAAREATGEVAIADDSGLEVDALDGRPGVFSARYAGENATDGENLKKVLADLAEAEPVITGTGAAEPPAAGTGAAEPPATGTDAESTGPDSAAAESAAPDATVADPVEASPAGSARYVCAIALIDGEGEHLFRGTCEGKLIQRPKGDGGFGYDPAFVPVATGPEDQRTMAELTPDEKNAISHRGAAARMLATHLSGE